MVMTEEFDFKNGWDYYPFVIAGHYLATLINDDATGLHEDEIADFNKWESDALRLVFGNTHHWDCSNNSHYGKDDITGLMADVVSVRLVFKKEYIK